MAMTKYSGQVDYFSVGSGLVCTESELTLETSVGVAEDDRGDIAEMTATIVGGTARSDYELKCSGDADLAILGGALTPSNLPTGALANLVPTGITISTAGGAMPTIRITGQLVDGSCADDKVFTAAKTWAAGLVPRAKAQLFGGLSVSGAGANCTSANYNIEGQFATSPKDGTGKRGSISVFAVVVTATLEIVQSGSVEPTLAAAGWTITKPLSPTGKIGEYTSWSVELQKPLARDVGEGS
jgi:hypothetical protein